MDLSSQALFLSLRPKYAEMIISGIKTVELRRIRPKAPPGTLVIVYASSPMKRVLGTCIVEAIGTATPEEIWKLHGASTGIDWSAVADYFRGKSEGVAITVRNPERFITPIPLDKIRKCLGDSAPPQSFSYVSKVEANALVRAGSLRKRFATTATTSR